MKKRQPLKQGVFVAMLSTIFLFGFNVNADEKVADPAPQETDGDVTDDASSEADATDAEVPSTTGDDTLPNVAEAVVDTPAPSVEPVAPKVAEAPVAAPEPPPPVEDQYYVLKIGQTKPEGPFAKAVIVQKITQKEISHYDQVQTVGTATWSRVYEMFPDAVYAKKPQVAVTRRYGIFSSPYRIKVDGKPYALKRKMKHVGSTFEYGQTYEKFEMSGFLYPGTREEKLNLPEAHRSGKTYPEYFWPSPLGQHMMRSGVNPGVISKREFNRKLFVITFLGTGLALVGVGAMMYDIENEFGKKTIATLGSGVGMMALALLANTISRKKTYRYLKMIETAH